jgi:hypothetical protein
MASDCLSSKSGAKSWVYPNLYPGAREKLSSLNKFSRDSERLSKVVFWLLSSSACTFKEEAGRVFMALKR